MTQTLLHEGAARAELPPMRNRVAMGAVYAAMAMVVLNATGTQVALPTIAQALQVTPAESVRVATVYQLALVMALLPCAALGERLGLRRVFLGGVALFALASVLCLLAPGLGWLAAARFVQGLGGACVMALGVALLRLCVPRDGLAPAIAWNALTVALASAAGPSLGAMVAASLGWRWLFALQLPVAAVAGLMGAFLPHAPGTGTRPDRWSMALSAGGFAALFIGLDRALASPLWGALGVAIALASLALLARRERDAPAPLLPLDLLRAAPFRMAVVASVCCFTGQAIALVALPFHLQHGLAAGPLAAGLLITPWPLAVALVAPVAGRLGGRVPTGLLCAIGGAMLALGLLGLAWLPLGRGLAPLVGAMALCGAGFGLFQTPNNHAMFLSAPPARTGAAGGLQGTARLLGQTAGAVLMSLLLGATGIERAARIGFGMAAALALAAGGVSLLRVRQPGPEGAA